MLELIIYTLILVIAVYGTTKTSYKTGFSDGKDVNRKEYTTDVLAWLVEGEFLDEDDLQDILKYANEQ